MGREAGWFVRKALNMTYAISKSGLALVRKFEGFQAEPTPLPRGGWVVGHGHVRKGAPGEAVTKAEAAALLAGDLERAVRAVNKAVETPLRQAQFDALTSFAFSIGVTAFAKSDVLARVNARDFIGAACAMDEWRKSTTPPKQDMCEALVLRRAAERALFLKDAPGAAAASAIVRAKRHVAPAPRKTLAAAIAAAPADPTQVLTRILKSEPATEALLLTRVAPADCVDEGELTTAHAAPVARKTAAPRLVMRRLDLKVGSENFGLLALLMFGGALVALGASIFVGGDAIDVAAGAALATPGLAASLMSGYGLWRAPQPKAVKI